MLKNSRFTLRTVLLLLMSLLIILPSASLYAQDDDDDDYDDEYYDDEYYDDEDYDDEDYDDEDYDDEDYDDEDYDDEDYDDEDYDDEDYDDEDYDNEDYDDEDYDDEYYDDEYYDDYDFADEDYGDEEADASYEVDGLELLGNPTEEHLRLWNAFIALIPEEYINNISVFEVISGGDTSGYVYADEDDPEKFVLGLNTIELDEPRELQHTIIHEFAHTLTLNAAQVDGTLERGGTCSTFELDEGCSEDNSYVFAFYGSFYGDGEDTEELDFDAETFVTDYAASNIAEDMAESFTFFILRPQPTGDSIADQKISFFYNFPELVELRDEIRANLNNLD